MLFILLYTTGMRISEARGLQVGDVDLRRHAITIRETKFYRSRLVPFSDGLLPILREYHRRRLQLLGAPAPEAPFFVTQYGGHYKKTHLALFVRLRGKGNKERVSPLWPETAAVLRDLLGRRGIEPTSTAPIFVNQRGERLGRDGVAYLLRKYVDKAGVRVSSLGRKRVHPHSIRHTTAVHMRRAGDEPNAIAALLGHAQITTTERFYGHVDLEEKRGIDRGHTTPDERPEPLRELLPAGLRAGGAWGPTVQRCPPRGKRRVTGCSTTYGQCATSKMPRARATGRVLDVRLRPHAEGLPGRHVRQLGSRHEFQWDAGGQQAHLGIQGERL